MPGDEPICLATARRRARVKRERDLVAFALTSTPDSVRALVGDGREQVDLEFSPDVWEMLAQEVLDACRAAREAKAREGAGRG
jgi:sarcosine oxidase gamma subunit